MQVEVLGHCRSELSAGEAKQLDRLAREMGTELYRQTAELAQRRFGSKEEIHAFARTVTRQEVRELIFDQLCRIAVPGTINHLESEELDRLFREWQIQTTLFV